MQGLYILNHDGWIKPQGVHNGQEQEQEQEQEL
jgi:hypothetical protein